MPVIHEEITLLGDTYNIGILLWNKCDSHFIYCISNPRRPRPERSVPRKLKSLRSEVPVCRNLK
jgi:hypothetical protein